MAETPFCIRDGLQSRAWPLKTPCPVDRCIKRDCASHSKGLMGVLWRACLSCFMAQGCARRVMWHVKSRAWVPCIFEYFTSLFTRFHQNFVRPVPKDDMIACRVCFRSREMPQTFPHEKLHSCLQKACKRTLHGLYRFLEGSKGL